MALALADRVQETSTTTGTGTLTLAGAVIGYQSFAVVGNGNTTYYTITNAAGAWEVGIGTYTSVGTTLSRTTVLSSSNAGSLVSFTGTLNVFVTYPAGKSVNLNESGVVTGYPITVLDSVFTLQDNLDTSKQAQFQLSSITTATTRAYTLPNVDTVLAGLAVSQTFSNTNVFSNGTNTFGSATGTGTNGFSSGATTTGNTKTVNIGTGGLSGSTTAITIGSSFGTTTNLLGILQISSSAGTSGQVLTSAGAAAAPTWTTPTTGTVTSVAATVPAFLSVTGSPITTSGTLAIAYSGTALPVANGGTGLTTLTANYIPYGNGTSAFQSYSGLNFASVTNSPANVLYSTGGMSIGTGGISYPTQATGTGYESKGGTSNGRFMVQDGNGRLNQYWNAYTDAGGYKYIVSGEPAARYLQTVNGLTGGTHGFYGAPSGTAGTALTWTQIGQLVSASEIWFSPRGTSSDFYITAAGNVGVGTSSPGGALSVSRVAGTAQWAFQLTNSVTAGTGFWQRADGSYEMVLRDISNNANYITNQSNDLEFTVNGVERLRIASTGAISLGATPGLESLRVTPVASAVNFLEAQGQIATGGPSLLASGSDTNIDLLLKTKGTGAINAYTNGSVLQFRVNHTASAANYLQVTGSASTTPTLSAQGSSTDVDLYALPKGAGGLVTYGSGQTAISISTTTLGGSVLVGDTGGAAGNGGALVFAAASTTWRFAAIKSYVTNGASNSTGDLYFLTRRNATDATLSAAMQIANTGTISLGAVAGNESLRVAPVASSINYLQIQGSAGTTPTLSAQGSGANLDIVLTPKGTGATYSQNFAASNGLVMNNATINTSYTLPTGYNAMSAGPVTIASGVVITVPSGSTWVVV